jgi:pyruvate dehydrogenase E1 component
MPEGCEQGVLNGLYKFKPGPEGLAHKAQILGSGPILRSALAAQEILATQYGVSADVWSATSYKRLRSEALAAQRWNRLHPTEKPRTSYLERTLAGQSGPFLAVSDFMKIVPDQIAPWVPGGLTTLGTDGFGRSDTRERLRRFFEVDTPSVVVATLHALSQRGGIPRETVAKAIRDLGINPEKPHPVVL